MSSLVAALVPKIRFWGLLFAFIGLVGIAIGIYQRKYSIKIDEQMQSTFEKEQNNILKEHSLTEQELIAEPAMFWGWDLLSQDRPRHLEVNRVNKVNLHDVLGPDGQWRSPSAIINTLLFIEDKMLSIKKYVSMVSSANLEEANEIKYQYITDVTTQIEELKAKNDRDKLIIKQRHVVTIHTDSEQYQHVVHSDEEAVRVKEAIINVWKQKSDLKPT